MFMLILKFIKFLFNIILNIQNSLKELKNKFFNKVSNITKKIEGFNYTKTNSNDIKKLNTINSKGNQVMTKISGIITACLFICIILLTYQNYKKEIIVDQLIETNNTLRNDITLLTKTINELKASNDSLQNIIAIKESSAIETTKVVEESIKKEKVIEKVFVEKEVVKNNIPISVGRQLAELSISFDKEIESLPNI